MIFGESFDICLTMTKTKAIFAMMMMIVIVQALPSPSTCSLESLSPREVDTRIVQTGKTLVSQRKGLHLLGMKDAALPANNQEKELKLFYWVQTSNC